MNRYPYPWVSGDQVSSGSLVELSRFCTDKLSTSTVCAQFYEKLKSERPGWYQCPFGMSCRTFHFDGRFQAITGTIATPRFGTDDERRLAKNYPEVRVARASIDSIVEFAGDVDRARADAVARSSEVLPQAFHELRKLNGAVLQLAEREIAANGETRGLVSIRSAAELMKNNFDILEALTNLDSMRVLPLDSTVNLFDLAFKLKRVYEEKAKSRELNISVDGVRAVITGSQKSFPIVPAVLVENAIKYSVPGTTILVDVSVSGRTAVLQVTNASREAIDVARCFERGVRFSSVAEGGGFGLYIAREIVTAHRGRISCEAGDGKVTMRVELPLKTIIEMGARRGGR